MRKILPAVAVVAIIAAACGDSGGDTTVDGVASLDSDSVALAADSDAVADDAAPATDEEALLAFAQCMRDNGVDMADPTVDADGNLRLQRPDGGGPDGADDAELRETREAAFAVCGEYLEGVAQGFRDRDRTELEDSVIEFARCMRDNGVDMPDPDFTSFGPGSGGGGPFGELDLDDPAFQAAQQACQDILSGFGRGPGGGPGGPPGGGDA